MSKRRIRIFKESEILRKAPTGRFRVIGFDTYFREYFLQQDYGSLAKAQKVAIGYGCGLYSEVHIYNDRGKLVKT